MGQLDTVWNDLLRDVMENGNDGDDRTGVGTRSVFGRQVRFDVNLDSFPIITEKRIVWNSLLAELVWFVRGETNVDFLHEHDVHIWDQWADESGEVGPVYGKQWREWEGPHGEVYDQLQRKVEGLRESPDSRRHVVSAWNVAELERMNLPPCHFAYQFHSEKTETGRKLDVKVDQRSCDLFIGSCFNFTSYATLLVFMSKITGHEPGEVIWSGGDVHIYQNHFDQVEKVLELETYEQPSLKLNRRIDSLKDVEVEAVELVGYEHGPFVKAPVAE